MSERIQTHHAECWRTRHHHDCAIVKVEALQSELASLREALEECADDLEAEVRNTYGWPDVHPALRWKFERDMQPVNAARALLTPQASPPCKFCNDEGVVHTHEGDILGPCDCGGSRG